MSFLLNHASRRRQRAEEAFDPTSLGATAWFDVALASDAGAGLAFTLPNRLNGSANATTSTDARKPTISAASNGEPILVCNASGLLVPLYAGINSSTTFWISFHARITSAAGNPVPWSIDIAGGGAASVRKLINQRFVGDNVHVFNAASTEARSFGPATLWTLSTWVHCIYEMALATGGAESDRGVCCRDGVAIISSYADSTGTPGTLPASTSTPTGSMNLLSQNAATGGNGWVGEIANIIIGNNIMSGVTSGCLTPAARLALSNFRRPA